YTTSAPDNTNPLSLHDALPHSTPRAPAPAPANARISEALPRTTVGLSVTSSRASSVRIGKLPTPTGSSTHGVAASDAACAASTIASRCSADGVPRLISTAPADRASKPASPGISTIAGLAPTARTALATRFVVTVFVKH